jgi:AraC-like DNA-binding protein
MSPATELPTTTGLKESAARLPQCTDPNPRRHLGRFPRLADRPAQRGTKRRVQDHVSHVPHRVTVSGFPLTVPQSLPAARLSANRGVLGRSWRDRCRHIRRQRIDHARRLSAASTMSISAIAASVGISDLRLFSEHIELSPGNHPPVAGPDPLIGNFIWTVAVD